MEFLIPILFAAAKKSLAAVLATLFLFTALRIADKRDGIVFSETWEKLHEYYQVRYLCVRLVCYTLLFIFVFTIS